MILTNEELKTFSRDHLLYEVQMLLELPRVELNFIKRNQLPFLSNARVESFAIHLRNLIDFFYPTTVRADDVCARHFFSSETVWSDICPEISSVLVKARNRAHKEISHITTDRISGTPPEKEWPMDELVEGIRGLLNIFTKSADTSKLDSVFTSVSR